jgi:hypothetical protein
MENIVLCGICNFKKKVNKKHWQWKWVFGDDQKEYKGKIKISNQVIREKNWFTWFI